MTYLIGQQSHFFCDKATSIPHPSAMCDTFSKHPPTLITLALCFELICLAESYFWNVLQRIKQSSKIKVVEKL